MLTKWTVRISSILYLAVVLPPNTELRRMFSLSFGYQTFGTLAVSEWVSDWVTRPNTITRFENRTCQQVKFISTFYYYEEEETARDDLWHHVGGGGGDWRIVIESLMSLLTISILEIFSEDQTTSRPPATQTGQTSEMWNIFSWFIYAKIMICWNVEC